MIPFTREKLYVQNKNIFYYDRFNSQDSIELFSEVIHQDLKDYIGIQREMKQREKMSQAITNEQKRFDEIKIHRVNMFYDYYIDQILQMTQMLYYENFKFINEENDDDFMSEYEDLIQTGLQLKQCFEKALKICEDIKLMIEKQIKIDYPIETFSDKFTKK